MGASGGRRENNGVQGADPCVCTGCHQWQLHNMPPNTIYITRPHYVLASQSLCTVSPKPYFLAICLNLVVLGLIEVLWVFQNISQLFQFKVVIFHHSLIYMMWCPPRVEHFGFNVHFQNNMVRSNAWTLDFLYKKEHATICWYFL